MIRFWELSGIPVLLCTCLLSSVAAADQTAACCAVLLDREAGSGVQQDDAGSSEWDRFELELLDRIRWNAEHGITATPVFVVTRRGETLVEVAGLSCEQAKKLVENQLLGGHRIALSLAHDDLILDESSVAAIARGSDGAVHLALTKAGTNRLRKVTRENVGKDVVVRVDGVALAEPIRIATEITSGRVSLRGDLLPSEFLDDLRLALPASVSPEAEDCQSEYSWTQGGKRFHFVPPSHR
jgi:hypothetical protein